LGNKKVLTAAHCVDQINDINNLKIVFHKQNLFSMGTSYQVKKILIHQNYDKLTSDNDIALIYFRRRTRCSTYIFTNTLFIKK